jgi:hypothetical protein
VPGPLDLAVNSLLPRKPLLSSFTSRLRSKIPKLHLASNPCRLKFFGQEVVIFRDDTMSRMLRNLVGVKPDARNEDLKRYVGVVFFFRALHVSSNPVLESSSNRSSTRATSHRSRRTSSLSCPSTTTPCASIPCLRVCVFAPRLLSPFFNFLTRVS